MEGVHEGVLARVAIRVCVCTRLRLDCALGDAPSLRMYVITPAKKKLGTNINAKQLLTFAAIATFATLVPTPQAPSTARPAAVYANTPRFRTLRASIEVASKPQAAQASSAASQHAVMRRTEAA